jgi:hypothetical protein
MCMTVMVALLLTACRDNKVVGEKPDTSGPVLTVTEALQPTNFDRAITVQGTIREVCQEEGCWMTITDGKKTVRMTFKDEAFRVAIASKGEVHVKGVIHEEIVDEASAQAIGPSMGMSAEAAAQLTGDQRWPLMTASGVEFLEPQP